jgi:hypothetical protein
VELFIWWWGWEINKWKCDTCPMAIDDKWRKTECVHGGWEGVLCEVMNEGRDHMEVWGEEYSRKKGRQENIL